MNVHSRAACVEFNMHRPERLHGSWDASQGSVDLIEVSNLQVEFSIDRALRCMYQPNTHGLGTIRVSDQRGNLKSREVALVP
jgi:hypothetical protein